MKKKTTFALMVSHLVAVGASFAAGSYALLILIAPPPPDNAMVAKLAESSEFVATFSRDRKDSDAFHWGEGEVSIGPDAITFIGQLAPGPDYRLYLSPEFVDTEEDFNRLKSFMVQAGEIKTFDNFIVPLPAGIDPSSYSAVIVWCESFGQFITSGLYEKKTM
jgi:hypothetical protein